MRAVNTGLFRFWGSQRWLWRVLSCWDITPYSPLKVNCHFGGTYRFHHQDRINRARYCHLFSRWYLALLILLWRCRRYVPLKRRLTFNGLYGVISQKTALFTRLFSLRSEVDIWRDAVYTSVYLFLIASLVHHFQTCDVSTDPLDKSLYTYIDVAPFVKE
jgi:hypothetical protein